MSKPPLPHSLVLARANAERTGRILSWAALPPLPLILTGAFLLQHFAPGLEADGLHAAVPPWYLDPFLLAMFAVYAFGQGAALLQLRTLKRGLGKVKAVLAALAASPAASAGSLPPGAGFAPFHDLQARLAALRVPGHLADLLNSWLRLGLSGDPAPIQSLMERGAWKRRMAVEKKIALHATLNRTMLKLGFLGTLLGLIVTFPPMKAAILTLDPKNVEKGASFVQHIAGAIDGDQYAILATMAATGLSLFIELLTVQVLRMACQRFEAVNAGVDEWCLTELLPAVRREASAPQDMDGMVARHQGFQQQMLDLERRFQEAWQKLQAESEARFLASQAETERRLVEALRRNEERLLGWQAESAQHLAAALEANGRNMTDLQQGLGRTVDGLGRHVRSVSESLDAIIPLQQGYGRRLEELVAYESQYRSFLDARDAVRVPRHLKPEIN